MVRLRRGFEGIVLVQELYYFCFGVKAQVAALGQLENRITAHGCRYKAKGFILLRHEKAI